MDLQSNPFAALSLIVAPAILTNASSVLALSTSNRLARAIDRARELTRQIEQNADRSTTEARRRLHELSVTETRAELLLRVLRSFYVALGGFATATLISLMGAVLVSVDPGPAAYAFELAALGTGVIAVGALVHGSLLLVRETRLAVVLLRERAASVRASITA